VPTSSESAVAELEVTLPADVDLHARPAATFVRAAMRFSAEVKVVSADREANAKSLLSVLALGAKRGTTLRLRATGEDAGSAIDALGTTIRLLKE
jgi:phosphotransferase system HPr (HPr) family protein